LIISTLGTGSILFGLLRLEQFEYYSRDEYEGKINTTVRMIWLILFFTIFICAYLRRREETKSDELSINLGYGADFERALTKIYKYYNPNYGLNKKQFFLTRCLKWMLSLFSFYPQNRMEMIKEKIKTYNDKNSINNEIIDDEDI